MLSENFVGAPFMGALCLWEEKMSQNNAKTIDLDRIFHYKNLPEKNRKIIIGVCVALFLVTSAVSMYKHFNRPVQPKIPPKKRRSWNCDKKRCSDLYRFIRNVGITKKC